MMQPCGMESTLFPFQHHVESMMLGPKSLLRAKALICSIPVVVWCVLCPLEKGMDEAVISVKTVMTARIRLCGIGKVEMVQWEIKRRAAVM